MDVQVELAANQARVWMFCLDGYESIEARMLENFDPTEKARAARYRFEIDRRRFIAGRAIAKAVLGLETGVSASEIRVGYGAHGKPELALGKNTPVRFNLAHSGGRAILAVALSEVGVDLEALRPELARDDTARSVFTSREYAAYLRLPPGKRVDSFFKGWTSKEAYLKGVGLGLSAPLQGFEVCVEPDAPARLISPLPGGEGWRLTALKVPLGYAAALATCEGVDLIDLRPWAGEGFDRRS